MKQLFLQKKQHPRLILFFSGWGMDEHLLSSVSFPACDVLYCYDYRTLDFDYTLLQPYQEVKVIAWSLGVWVASVILPQSEIPVNCSIAINGTLNPIDADEGIPLSIFQGTIDHMDERGLYKFQRRMCNTQETFHTFLAHAAGRPVEELQEELVCLRDAILSPENRAEWIWNQVYISASDRIFTCANQQEAWKQQAPCITVEEGHYCPLLFTQLLEADE